MNKLYYYFNNKNYPIRVTNKTTEIAKYTFHKDGTMWETPSIIQFFNNISNNEKYNIVDIGAQVGLYSLYGKFLPKSTFYSFEPFPDTFNELNENIRLNHIYNVKTFNIAISDNEGETILNTSIGHNGLHTLGKNPLRFNDIKPIIVKTSTLDKIFFDIPIHFIKIDTEGYEYFIIKGGINSIKKYKPIIQLEWNIINMKQCNVTESMMEELLEEIGYHKIGMVEEEILIASIN
jgi:FkbM family methyltransferase